MNYPVPFIALLTLSSKLITKKFPHSALVPCSLIAAIFCSGLIFYAGFAHLISSETFYFICWLPAVTAFIFEGLERFGYARFGIPVSIALNCLAASLFFPFGFLKVIQVAWSLSLMSSIIATLRTDFINPLKEARRKKHEFSI